MMGHPSVLLFEEALGKGGNPLFMNQADLVLAITENSEGTFYNKNQNTVKSAVSQIINGERNLSKNWRNNLLLVAEARFDKKRGDFGMFRERLLQSFKSNFEEKTTNKRSKLGDRDFWDLLKDTRKAEKILITTTEPAELHKSREADILKEELLTKIGILEDDEVSTGSYVFFLPKERLNLTAREFWEKLRDFALGETSMSVQEINERLLAANQDGRLKVYLVEDKILLMPFVFCDYHKHTINGYCVSYNEETPSVAKLSFKAIDWWYGDVYARLCDEQNSVRENYIEYSYEQLKEN